MLANTQFVLSPPPANDSDIAKKEVEALLGLQAARTKEHEKKITDSLHRWQFVIGGRKIGDLAKNGRPETWKLFELIERDVGYVILQQKEKFDRVRPSYFDRRIVPIIPNPGHPAYPSGHSTQAHTFALILSRLDPNGKEACFKSAAEIASLREAAGVHYASDSIAGKLLADQIVEGLFKSPLFLGQFRKAEKEW